MLAVTVTLDEIAGSCSGARSNDCAFLPADQCSADCPGNSANHGSLGLTVVMAVRSLMGEPIR